jgi:cytoskeletal protein RodZ
MADITKIQPNFLQYLEEERFEELPAEVYVRGFLRSYARELRLDEEDIVELYFIQTGQQRAERVDTDEFEASNTFDDQSRLARFANQTSLSRYAYGIGLAALVLVATVVVLMFTGNDTDDQASANFQSEWSVESWQPSVESSDDWRQR